MELTNFRDLGGLVGFNGKTVVEKKILRAGEPVNLCESDVLKLKDDYKLSYIIDFRGEKEVNEKPVDTVEGASYLNIDILASHMKEGGAPTLEDMVNSLSHGAGDMYMAKAYRDLVISEDALTGYRQFIDAVLGASGALLFHCMAGKDRTGWGAVILLKMLGVTDEDIMTDYLATVEGRRAANLVLIEGLRQKGVDEEKLDAFADLMSVKPSYLQAAYDVVTEHFGTFENYLSTGLKVTEDEINQLREMYLV